jgi:glycosyltransferase involved in cell wall biosynthesis
VKTRILYLIGDLKIGGAQRQLVYLAQRLDRSQFEPIVCCLSDNAPLAEELQAAGVKVVVLPQWLRPDVSRFWRIPQIVKRYRPHLIHAYLFVANTWGRTTGWLYGLPVIISERNATERKNFGERLINSLLAPTTTKMLANSNVGAELAIRSGEITPQLVQVIYNGISLEPFQDASIGDQIRKELNIAADQPVVGIVARLSPVKDHHTFFRAMALVVKQTPDLRILCVGDGPYRPHIEELVIELGLEPNVIFTGNRKDVPAIMFALDLLVLSSKSEAFPNVIMEAMAAERAVIATHVGDVAELVLHEKTGLLVQPGNPETIAQAVTTLLADKPRRIEMGRQGRKHVEAHFTLDRMLAATVTVYRQIVAENRS